MISDRGDIVKSINLQNSNLKKSTVSGLLSQIRQTPNQLNLQNNKVGLRSCEILGKFISNRKQNLKELNLESSKLGNCAAVKFFLF